MSFVLPVPAIARVTTTTLCLIVAFLTGEKFFTCRKKYPKLPPAVPGLPLIGNLHQLDCKKPYNTFAKWSEIYGPIYSVKLGSSYVVVLNSTELAKEALVTRFSSISGRKLSKALKMLTHNKSLVSMSDYGEYHKMIKEYLVTSVLGDDAQKKNRDHRNVMIENIVQVLFTEISDDPHRVVNLKEPVQIELFRLALKEALGKDIETESIYVDELGAILSRKEIHTALVSDPLIGGIEVDWRDFFPYMRWFPNKKVERNMQRIVTRRNAVTKALITQQKGRIARGEAINCYLDFLSATSTLTEEQVMVLIWESIVESSDVTLVTVEWAMYQLAKNSNYQERLYHEILCVCGADKISEEHLPHLPYLNPVVHETLRLHTPFPIPPPRYVHEETQLGGFNVPAGTEIAINLHACKTDKKDWAEPDEWKPEKFLHDSRCEQTDLFKTMAFGAGKRACPGTLEAMLISCTAIGRLIQEFRWRLKEGEEENIDTVRITNHKLHPMQAYIAIRGL